MLCVREKKKKTMKRELINALGSLISRIFMRQSLMFTYR